MVLSLAVAAAIALGACGGDDEKKKPQNAGVQTDIPIKTTGGPSEQNGKDQAERKSKEAKKERRRKRPRNARESFARLSPSERSKVIRGSIPRLLAQYGYKNAIVAVAAGGDRVRITIPPGEVCGGPENTSLIESKVRLAAPLVKVLTIEVGGTGQSVAGYFAGHCKKRKPPKAGGPVVLRVAGSGPRDTESFRVRHKRWTISYSNKGSSLGIFVFYRKKIQPGPITTQERSSGKKVVKGKGRFNLKILGPGPYEVVVHDGA